jgi:predicted XRE-type DNA-binding protein
MKKAPHTKPVKTVFETIGIDMSPVDLLKAKVAAAISQHIQAAGLTQAQAAKALGVDQPKVSMLLRGRLDDFSLDRLVAYATALGHGVEMKISRPRKVA